MTTFRLEGLLRLRRLQEDQAAAELARRSGERERAQERSSHAEERLSGADLTGAVPAERFRGAVAARAALSAAVSQAHLAEESARAAEALAQDGWFAARRRTKSLDRLARRHQGEESRSADRAEQQVLDELATQRATRKEPR